MKYKLSQFANSKIILRKKSKYCPKVTCETKTIERLASFGLTMVQIAYAYDVTDVQFAKAVRRSRNLRKAIERGGLIAEFNMVNSLYMKGTGYDRKEVRKFRYKNKLYCIPYTKHYPPNIQAIIFWLTNRCPDEWKKNPQARRHEPGRPKLDMEYIKKLREIAWAEKEEESAGADWKVGS